MTNVIDLSGAGTLGTLTCSFVGSLGWPEEQVVRIKYIFTTWCQPLLFNIRKEGRLSASAIRRRIDAWTKETRPYPSSSLFLWYLLSLDSITGAASRLLKLEASRPTVEKPQGRSAPWPLGLCWELTPSQNNCSPDLIIHHFNGYKLSEAIAFKPSFYFLVAGSSWQGLQIFMVLVSTPLVRVNRSKCRNKHLGW